MTYTNKYKGYIGISVIGNSQDRACKRRCSDTKQETLNISFHNPNTTDVFVKEMIQVSAEIAKASITGRLLHSSDMTTNKEGQAVQACSSLFIKKTSNPKRLLVVFKLPMAYLQRQHMTLTQKTAQTQDLLLVILVQHM